MNLTRKLKPLRSLSRTSSTRFTMNYLGGVIEKAVYADTPQNRRLNRVGQEYHRGRKKQGGAAPEPSVRNHQDDNKTNDKPKPLTKNMQIKVNRISHAIECAVKRRVFGSLNSDKDVDFSKVKVEDTGGGHFMMSYNGKTVQYFDRDSDFTPKAVKAAIAEGFKRKLPF